MKKIYECESAPHVQYFELYSNGKPFNTIDYADLIERSLSTFYTTFGKYLPNVVCVSDTESVRLTYSMNGVVSAEFTHTYAFNTFPVYELNNFIYKVETSYRNIIATLVRIPASETKDCMRDITHYLDSVVSGGYNLLDNAKVTNELCRSIQRGFHTVKARMCDGLLIEHYALNCGYRGTYKFIVDNDELNNYIVIGRTMVEVIQLKHVQLSPDEDIYPETDGINMYDIYESY